jgi:membrane-bound inhibitor of C-type lysozyme
MKTSTIAVLLIGIVIIAGGAWYVFSRNTETPVATATYSCDAGKTITATFYKDKVDLVLSDGRKQSEPQVISGSGARYANKDESFVFWNKGNTAFITEGSPAVQTFSNCIAPDASGNLIEVYASSTLGTIQYPKGYTVNEAYMYTQFQNKPIHGVSFTIPPSMATGTNLSSDTYVSIEQLPRAKICTGDIYLTANVKAQTITDNGVHYSVASSTGAGAGNRYEETVYALPDSHPCTAVRYFVHYGVIENYPPGMVTQFDSAALMSAFDTIRRSLVVPSPGV